MSDTKLKPKVRTEKSIRLDKNYYVILLNDNYTLMEFVILVLEKFFNKSGQEAVDLMLKIHNEGNGVCGIYNREIAETKAREVINFAESYKQPLRCKIKKSD